MITFLWRASGTSDWSIDGVRAEEFEDLDAGPNGLISIPFRSSSVRTGCMDMILAGEQVNMVRTFTFRNDSG